VKLDVVNIPSYVDKLERHLFVTIEAWMGNQFEFVSEDGEDITEQMESGITDIFDTMSYPLAKLARTRFYKQIEYNGTRNCINRVTNISY